MFTEAKDIWFPYIHRNSAAMIENCRGCTAAKNLETICSKGELGTIPEPKEASEPLQLDFLGLNNHLNESKNYVIVAVDQFSRLPSAMVCGTNRSD